MFAALKLEAIGDATRQRTRLAAGILREAGFSAASEMYEPARPYPWVARITGIDAKYGMARQFIRGRKDYSTASGNGNRGIFLHYLLEEGIYEIQDVTSWSKVDRYFVRSSRGVLDRITKEEVLSCLRGD